MDQIIFEDKDNLNKISILLRQKNIERVFVVSGKKSYDNSSAREIIQPILTGFSVFRFYNFEENPKVEDVIRGVNFFNENNCQIIVAIGGGSVIDMAKLIKAYHDNFIDIKSKISNSRVGECSKELIAIPTTAGSGSEATQFAVVYINKIKYSVSNVNLLPNIVHLVPELTYSTSPYLTAITGLDAFSQAIESWWSVNSTEESIAYSKEAVKIIYENLGSAIENNRGAKRLVQQASYLAGKAINIAKTTAPHALSYGFSTYCNLPHGHAVSIFLPNFVELHTKININNCNDSRGVEYVNDVMNSIAALMGTAIEFLADKIYMFINDCGISINYKELSITRQRFEKSISNINQEGLKNNPVIINSEFISELYFSKLNNK
ncbi:MAG: phosphonoacetaldehyde reductase [Salinivirgaceae bacterium]|nr:phosphonoacetaldehyde reductase [Salinivirgaceae bacterium]